MKWWAIFGLKRLKNELISQIYFIRHLQTSQWHLTKGIMSRKKAPTLVQRLINRICNPQDVLTSWTIAAILLVVEALLCLTIIAKVPCMSRCCKFYHNANLICKFLFRHRRECGIELWYYFLLLLVDTEIDWVAYMDEVAGYDKVI